MLICKDCRSVEPLPDYDGDPDHDVLLDGLIEAHVFPNGEKHYGNLASVPDDQWNNPNYRSEILKQIAKRTTGLEGEYYATKCTYENDAMNCYSKHGRPTEGCIDWEDSKKRIGNPTKVGWQVGPKVYLCGFCPVKSWVDTQKRWKAGIYKEK